MAPLPSRSNQSSPFFSFLTLFGDEAVSTRGTGGCPRDAPSHSPRGTCTPRRSQLILTGSNIQMMHAEKRKLAVEESRYLSH